MTVRRVVSTRTPPDVVFAYLRDFENAVEWDSGTLSCTRTSGDGGPGTRYRNVSRFMGRTVTLDYTVDRSESPTLALTGRSGGTTTVDTITVTPTPDGSRVDYRAAFRLTGPARWVAPVVRIFLQRLADATETSLREALDRQ